MLPDYGCNLRDFQFEPVNNTFLGFIEDLVRRAILFFEPRIEVENITITEPADSILLEGKLSIEVEFRVQESNSRSNFVYDFYLREADGAI